MWRSDICSLHFPTALPLKISVVRELYQKSKEKCLGGGFFPDPAVRLERRGQFAYEIYG